MCRLFWRSFLFLFPLSIAALIGGVFIHLTAAKSLPNLTILPAAQFESLAVPPRTTTGFYYPLNNANPSVSAAFLEGDGSPGHPGHYLAGPYHLGVDMPASIGSPVYAIANGVVTDISRNGWGCDNYPSETGNVALLIRHSTTTGDVIGIYGHITTTLAIGATVVAGQQIGAVAEWCLGSHLHFGIYQVGGYQGLPGPYANGIVGCNSVGYGKVGICNWQNSYGQMDGLAFIRTNGPIVGGAFPDLRVVYLSATPTNIQPNGAMYLETRVENVGATSASAFTVQFYISTDQVVDGGDMQFAYANISLLAAGSSMIISGTVTFPSVAAGTKYVIVKADSLNAINELDETNNIRNAQITVTSITRSPADQQALDDMKRMAPRLNSMFRSAIESSLAFHHSDSSWDYRYMYFYWGTNKTTYMFHATYKYSSTIRYVQYWNPDTNTYSPWYVVY